jgi:hypothetical protein
MAVVQVDVDPAATPHLVRLFARAFGAARIASVESEPPGNRITTATRDAGEGLLLPLGRAVLRVALFVDGPAALDLFELDGGSTTETVR